MYIFFLSTKENNNNNNNNNNYYYYYNNNNNFILPTKVIYCFFGIYISLRLAQQVHKLPYVSIILNNNQLFRENLTG